MIRVPRAFIEKLYRHAKALRECEVPLSQLMSQSFLQPRPAPGAPLAEAGNAPADSAASEPTE